MEKAEEKRKRKAEKLLELSKSFREVVPTNSNGRDFKRKSKGQKRRYSLQKIRHNVTGQIINLE